MDNSYNYSQDSEKLEKYNAKYRLAGRKPDISMKYNPKYGVTLNGINIQVCGYNKERQQIVVEIPEFVSRIDTYELFWQPYSWALLESRLSIIREIDIIGNGRELTGNLDGILQLACGVDPREGGSGGPNGLDLRRIKYINFYNLDLQKFQSITYVQYADDDFTHALGIRLINSKPPKVNNFRTLAYLLNGDSNLDVSSLGISNMDEVVKSEEHFKCASWNLNDPRLHNILKFQSLDEHFKNSWSITKMPKLNIQNCDQFNQTFDQAGIEGTLQLDPETLGINRVYLRSAYRTFNGCPINRLIIKDLTIENHSENGQVNLREMFNYCKNLEEVCIENLKFVNFKFINVAKMFSSCFKLKRLQISNIDFGDSDVDIQKLVEDCKLLEYFKFCDISCRRLILRDLKGLNRPIPLMSRCKNIRKLEFQNYQVAIVTTLRRSGSSIKRVRADDGAVEPQELMQYTNLADSMENELSLLELASVIQVDVINITS